MLSCLIFEYLYVLWTKRSTDLKQLYYEHLSLNALEPDYKFIMSIYL